VTLPSTRPEISVSVPPLTEPSMMTPSGITMRPGFTLRARRIARSSAVVSGCVAVSATGSRARSVPRPLWIASFSRAFQRPNSPRFPACSIASYLSLASAFRLT